MLFSFEVTAMEFVLDTAEKIKILCERKNITMTALAEKCGWSKSNLSNKLKRNNFTEEDLKTIASALGLELNIDFVEPEEK